MLVINHWGGPGVGKSTMAAGLFHHMKTAGHRVELVTEYAKELVYERRDLTDQLSILAQQNKRLRRLRDHVDYVITDSPLPLGLVYASTREGTSDWFIRASIELYQTYENLNVFVLRQHPFQLYGRVHDAQQSRRISHKLSQLVYALDPRHVRVPARNEYIETVYRGVLERGRSKDVS